MIQGHWSQLVLLFYTGLLLMDVLYIFTLVCGSGNGNIYYQQ